MPDPVPDIVGLQSGYQIDLGDELSITPSNANAGTTTWSLLPAQPVGSSFDTNSGHITGTPTATQDVTYYTITATTDGGSDQKNFWIEILPLGEPLVGQGYTSSMVSSDFAPANYGQNGVQYFGKDKELFKATKSVDRKGLMTGTAVWFAKTENAENEAPRILSFHPFDNNLKAEKVAIDYGPAFATITAHYAGMAPGADTTNPVYELSFGVGQEPITVHPDFVDKIGGKPSAPLNKAVFRDAQGNDTNIDTKGTFHHFELDSDLAGVEAFLDVSNITFRERYTARNRPTGLGRVGSISSPSNAPNLPGNRNWLYVGLSYQQRADIFSVSREWRGSGKGRWNSLIY